MPRTPAGGINPAPTNKFVLWTNRDGPAHPGGRRAGCPHPAAPRAAANPRGRIWNPPYNQRRARGQPENRKPCVTSNPCRGRCSHRPGGPYAARMPAGGMPLIPPHPAPPRTPAGGYGIRPYNQRRARGQPGNRKPCVTSNPCRGRCSHRPGGPYAARTPAGGYGIRPYNQRRVRGQPGNRCPCVIINFCRGRCSHRPADLAPPHGSLPIRAK